MAVGLAAAGWAAFSKQCQLSPPRVCGTEVIQLINLDHDRIDEIVELGRECAEDIFGSMIKVLRTDIERFQASVAALDESEARAIALAAHTLKGLALTVGADELGSMLADCERLAKAGNVVQIRARLDTSGTMIDETLDALTAIAAQ